MRTIIFKGLRIRIENEAGSVRKGVDNNGKAWETTMAYPYGEVLGSMGVDGDPVDVFIGPNKAAKWVYGIHQTRKDGSGYDEQKFMLGFNDVMDAKQAFFKSYDEPAHFYTEPEAILFDDFKKKVKLTKNNPVPIHAASSMNNAIELYERCIMPSYPDSIGLGLSRSELKAEGTSSAGPGIGEPVTVDGMNGRGVIVRIDGRKITVKFRSGEYLTRDVGSVHSLNDNYYKSRYSSVR